MTVIQTDCWLQNYLEDERKQRGKVHRDVLCEKLVPYFDHATAYDIQEHLIGHGLFVPSHSDGKMIEEMRGKPYWKWAETELKQLMKKWNGPDIPVFIFPSNDKNRQLQTELNGKSGLAYNDKVLLFVAAHTPQIELRALLTHEYNHVCRLHYLNQREEMIELLDSIILEGLAERAVYERLGAAYTATWTSIYPMEKAKKSWGKWLKPYLKIKKATTRHDSLLYGNGRVPKWLGYNAGYHIVTSFAENSEVSMKELLQMPAEEILEGSAFA